MSQIFVLFFIFLFHDKKRVTFYIGLYFRKICSRFYKKRTRTYIKNLRHSSLNDNVVNAYEEFQAWVLNIKRDIHIKTKNV